MDLLKEDKEGWVSAARVATPSSLWVKILTQGLQKPLEHRGGRKDALWADPATPEAPLFSLGPNIAGDTLAETARAGRCAEQDQSVHVLTG